MVTKLPGVMPANDLTVTSTLKLNRYSVSFCVDGVEISEYTGLYTFPIVYPADPVKSGYEFKGWVLEDGGSVPEAIPLGDITVNAVFEEKPSALKLYGKWQWVASPGIGAGTGGTNYNVSFKSNGESLNSITITNDGAGGGGMIAYNGDTVYEYTSGWVSEEYRIVDFGSSGVAVDSDFYNYFTSNASIYSDTPKLATPSIYLEEALKLATPTIYIEEILPKLDTPSIRLEDKIAENERCIYWHDRQQYNDNGVLAYTDWGWGAVTGCVPGEVIQLVQRVTYTGYTSTEWTLEDGSPMPEIMPDEDLHLYMTYNLNTYKATFFVSGGIYGEYEGLYTFPIEYPKDPVKEGYEFTGWSPSMVNMPAEDVELEATFQVAKKKLSTPTIYLEVGEEGDDSDTHYIINKETLTEIGDAIRIKMKSTSRIPVPELADRIGAIPELKYREIQNGVTGTTVSIEYK